MGWVDWFAFLTGVVCVYLIVRERDVNWPIGVVNSVALLYIFWTQQLWAQVGLQAFYTVECLYGWWMWTRRDADTGRKLLHIGTTPRQTRWILCGAGAVGVVVLAPILSHTGDPYPFWDAVVGVASLLAEYMLCLKLMEAWGVYLGCDLISLVLLALLGQWVTFGTYLCFTFLCVMGIREWWRRYVECRVLAAATRRVPAS